MWPWVFCSRSSLKSSWNFERNAPMPRDLGRRRVGCRWSLLCLFSVVLVSFFFVVAWGGMDVLLGFNWLMGRWACWDHWLADGSTFQFSNGVNCWGRHGLGLFCDLKSLSRSVHIFPGSLKFSFGRLLQITFWRWIQLHIWSIQKGDVSGGYIRSLFWIMNMSLSCFGQKLEARQTHGSLLSPRTINSIKKQTTSLSFPQHLQTVYPWLVATEKGVSDSVSGL